MIEANEKSYQLLMIGILSVILLTTSQCQRKTSPCENQIDLQPNIYGKWVWVESLRTADGVTDTLRPQTTGVKYFIDISSDENCSFLQFRSDHGLNSFQIIKDYSYSDTYYDDHRAQSNILYFESGTGTGLYFSSVPGTFNLVDSICQVSYFPYKFADPDIFVVNKFRRQ